MSRCFERIELKPVEAGNTESESKILEFAKDNPSIFRTSIGGRLLDVLKLQPQGADLAKGEESAVLRHLNVKELQRIRELCLGYVDEQRLGIQVILDDLVPSNDRQGHKELSSSVVLSAMLASQDLWASWNTRLAQQSHEPKWGMLLFVRSDLYASAIALAEEPDKIRHSVLYWDDADSLLSVIERRIAVSAERTGSGVANWNDLLDSSISLEDLKRLVQRSVLSRPRDVIVLFVNALFHARRKGQATLSKEDFRLAMEEYSIYALEALSAEWHPGVADMRDMLYEFLGGSTELSYDELSVILGRSGVEEENVEGVIRFLIESQFLGIAIDENNFSFAASPHQIRLMGSQAGRFKHNAGGERKFRIHPAFHHSLILTKRAKRRVAGPDR